MIYLRTTAYNKGACSGKKTMNMHEAQMKIEPQQAKNNCINLCTRFLLVGLDLYVELLCARFHCHHIRASK